MRCRSLQVMEARMQWSDRASQRLPRHLSVPKATLWAAPPAGTFELWRHRLRAPRRRFGQADLALQNLRRPSSHGGSSVELASPKAAFGQRAQLEVLEASSDAGAVVSTRCAGDAATGRSLNGPEAELETLGPLNVELR
ncbi:unnamed protein product [Symbiodinium natans]|uniref:Uncharacterized protein n=1 Tax=Symbiodinium natans TaxID=878477 RepID=A0A812JK67_9DINO|nr:unnamed protein product [Symbiodinium natans]